jgi:hypothetical protein
MLAANCFAAKQALELRAVFLENHARSLRCVDKQISRLAFRSIVNVIF